MSKEQDKLLNDSYNKDVDCMADRMGILTEYRKLEGTRKYLECMVDMQRFHSKMLKYSDPVTLAPDLRFREVMVESMIRAVMWYMERGIEGNEDNWDNRTYFEQKLSPVLKALGYKPLELQFQKDSDETEK